MKIVFFSSKTGNTERFASKIGYDVIRISIDLEMDEDFVLFCPTYADGEGKSAVPPQVIKFLNKKINREHLLGVVGFGNRNFGQLFALGSEVISRKCNVPILHKVELFGTQTDVEIVKEKIKNVASAG